jgi:hypothetical protein
VTFRIVSRLSPAGPLSAGGRRSLRQSRVSWFGWNGRFLVPAMHSNSLDATAGSRIAEGNRRSRRAASLNRTARPGDHRMTRGLEAGNPGRSWSKENRGRGRKKLDLGHSRLVVTLSDHFTTRNPVVRPRLAKCWTLTIFSPPANNSVPAEMGPRCRTEHQR